MVKRLVQQNPGRCVGSKIKKKMSPAPRKPLSRGVAGGASGPFYNSMTLYPPALRIFLVESPTGAPMEKILSALLLLSLTLPLSGCFMIGYIIGSQHDYPSKEFTRLSQMDDLSKGTPVTLVTIHNDTLKGDVAAFRKVPEYEDLFRTSVSGTPLSDIVSAPGELVTIVAHRGAEYFAHPQYRFEAKVLGFDPGIVSLLPLKSENPPVLPLSSLDSILSHEGHSIATPALLGMIEGNRVPFISQLGILLPDTLWIRSDEISVIFRKRAYTGMLVGFLIGAAVDVGVVAIAAHSFTLGFGHSP
jgi:hypothetical protein